MIPVELLGALGFVLLIDELSSSAPPLGEATQFAALQPDSVRAAAVEDDATLSSEIDVTHALGAHGALAVDDLVVVAEVSGDLVKLSGIQPDEGIGLCLEK